MANFGLSKPIVATLNVATGKYSAPIESAKLINTSVTPNSTTAQLYADNDLDEDVTEFTNASVTLGINVLDTDLAQALFNHTVASGVETSKSSDTSAFVGFGFVTSLIENGAKKYQGCVLPKVKFEEPAESFETKGNSISFSTPTINGTAYADASGVWRIKGEKVDTLAAAVAWIKTKLPTA